MKKQRNFLGLALVMLATSTLWADSFSGSGFSGTLYMDGSLPNNSLQYITSTTGTGALTSFQINNGDNLMTVENVTVDNAYLQAMSSTSYYSTNGYQYTLSGTPTGVTYTFVVPPGDCCDQVASAATSNPTNNFYTSLSNAFGYSGNTPAVFETDQDWQNPVFLFATSFSYSYTGISYDADNNSLWIADSGAIVDYSLTGTVLSSFTSTGAGQVAYDATDHTLWTAASATNSAAFNQYDVSVANTGTLLQTGVVDVGAIDSMEFGPAAMQPAPEPGSMLLLGTGLLGFGRMIRRKAAKG